MQDAVSHSRVVWSVGGLQVDGVEGSTTGNSATVAP